MIAEPFLGFLRRKGSHWTLRNRERCMELEQRGLMTDAGREAQK